METSAILFENHKILLICKKVLDQFKSYETGRKPFTGNGTIITYQDSNIAKQIYNALKFNLSDKTPLLRYIYPNFFNEHHYEQNRLSHHEKFPTQDYPISSSFVSPYLLDDATIPTFYLPSPPIEVQLDEAYHASFINPQSSTSAHSSGRGSPVVQSHQTFGNYSPASSAHHSQSTQPFGQSSGTHPSQYHPSTSSNIPSLPHTLGNFSPGSSAHHSQSHQPFGLHSLSSGTYPSQYHQSTSSNIPSLFSLGNYQPASSAQHSQSYQPFGLHSPSSSTHPSQHHPSTSSNIPSLLTMPIVPPPASNGQGQRATPYSNTPNRSRRRNSSYVPRRR